MSLKTKLTSLITTFVLLCSLLTVGVFAVKNTTFNVGGNIEFNVQGIEADIELTANGVQNAVLADNAAAGTDAMNKIEIRNNTSADSIASQFAKWSNLDMTFAEGQSTATIELKITNRATEEDNYIDITALADATTKDNAKIKVANNAGGITALLKSGEDATFTITFEVKDDEYKASLNDFSVNFDMQKKVLADFPVLSADMTYQTLKFRTIDGESGLSVGDIGAYECDYKTTGDLVIPAYVNNGGIVYPVITIADGAFGEGMYGATGMNTVILPNTITSIGYMAFASCSNLTSIIIPDSVTIISGESFVCTGLTSIIIPDSVTNIGYGSFDSCVSLISVTIGNGVTIIGDSVFSGCSNLTSITIPDSVTSIGNNAFSNCTSLTSIVVESGNSVYDSRNNCNAIIKTATNTLIQSCKNTVIPNTVKIINNCSGLTNVIIPEGVTKLGKGAFADSVTSLTIPVSVTSIEEIDLTMHQNLKTVNYAGTQEQWLAIEGVDYIEEMGLPSGCTMNFLG